MKICYVILHYQNLEVTIDCIKSLDKIKNNNSIILVVDNGSPNQSGTLIKEKFNHRNDIKVIINTKNLGFAKGNNLGYSIAKNDFNADIIVVMNNDVFINDNDFENKIKEMINAETVHIIAPDIVTSNLLHQNPHRLKRLSNYRVIKRILFYSVVLLSVKIKHLADKIVERIYKRSLNKNKRDNQNSSIYNIVPHGACIIYTREYIKNEDIAFIPTTFLFCEEDLLYDYAIKKNYTIVYWPRLQVKHLEDASINYERNASLDKFVFNFKNRRNSLVKLLINRFFPYRN